MNEMKLFANILLFPTQVIMWLSSKMVDSYSIRAIVCSGQKVPKNQERRRETRSTKGRVLNPKTQNPKPKTKKPKRGRGPQKAE